MDNIKVTAAFDAGVEAFCKEAGLDKEAIWNILAQLLGKGANANARHPQKATRQSKRSFDNRYKGMIDRIREVSEMSLAANTQSEIKK